MRWRVRWMCLNRSHRKLEFERVVKLQKYWITHNFFNFDHNIGMLHLKMIVLMRWIQLNKNFTNLSYPVLTTTQNEKKLHIFQFFSHPFYMGILYMMGHVLMRWMYLNRSHRKLEWEHVVKLQKYWITHNFFNFDHNIGMFHLNMIILMRGIQLNKNLLKLGNPVLTTTQNEKKLQIFDSISLVILSVWAYKTQRDMYWWS